VLSSFLNAIPRVPQVQVIGHGVVNDHEGIPKLELKHGDHRSFHKTQIPPEEGVWQGKIPTRFFRWHTDAAFYRYDPPKVTTLYAIKVPKGPSQIVRYDDGTRDELEVPLGTTAFASGRVMFELLPPAWKSFAVRARARYAPRPFEWIVNAKARSTGLGLVSEGLETPLCKLSEWNEEDRKTYPFVSWWRPSQNIMIQPTS